MRIQYVFVLSLLLAAPLAAQGDTIPKGVRLGLTYPTGTNPGIAILPVRGDHGDSVRAILMRDLDYSDRITVVGTNADELPPVSGEPNFDLFSKMNVMGIVSATVTADGLHITVWDASKKNPMQVLPGIALPSPALGAEWRMAVHRASDDIEQWARGTRGIAATRIAFVRGGKVWMVDSDGEDAMPVPGSDWCASPAWAPTGNAILFTMNALAGPSGVLMYDLMTGKGKRLTPVAGSGTYGATAFSPDGTTLLYAFGLNSTDLWSMDLRTPGAQGKRVTFAQGSQINTSPSFSPDGHKMVFTSDRLGHVEVYISDADGSNADWLTQGTYGEQSQRSNPAWSPDGRFIAYQSRTDGEFQLMTISPTGKNPTSLTSDSQNEDPSWAADSRHIVFTSRRSHMDQLWVLDMESGRMRQLTHGSTPSKASAWSPLLYKR